MRKRTLENKWIKAALEYAGAVCLCLLLLTVLLQLWRADFPVPFRYDGDVLLHSMFIKGMIDNGWYWENPFLGMPMGLKMYDFPAVDNLPFLLIKGISFFTTNHGTIINLFFLLTFPLTTISTLYLWRSLNLSYLNSLCGALLYTFLPYHFFRNESHLFLSAYYLVPLVVLVVLWICQGRLSAIVKESSGLRIRLRSFEFIFAVAVSVLVGSSGVYYPFFACFFLLVAGVIVWYRQGNFRYFLPAGALILIIFGTVVVNLSPSIIHIFKNGNIRVVDRGPGEAETYGLKIAQLVLPINGHRLPWLAHIKDRYNLGPLVTENGSASLGIVGSVGFLALLWWLFFNKPATAEIDSMGHRALVHHLSLLNGAAVLLATIGGFGSLFAQLVSPQIRTYNRVSVFIAVFSLLTVSVGLEHYRNLASTRRHFLPTLLIVTCLIVGILDQTSKHFVPRYGEVKAEYENDKTFVSQLESTLSPEAMVFQLPYVPFPEYPEIYKMKDYDLFRGYLHSKHLRWSYGAMKKREGDSWQRLISELPAEKLVPALCLAGFSGIYVDRYGYADGGELIENDLGKELGKRPQLSEDSRLMFFNLTDYSRRLRDNYGEDVWQKLQAQALNPLLLFWAGAFSNLERGQEKSWRWCGREGELHIHNATPHQRKVELEMSFATGHPEKANMVVLGPGFYDQLQVSSSLTAYKRTLTIDPGDHVIKFHCDADKVFAPLDTRYLVFRIENFLLQELE